MLKYWNIYNQGCNYTVGRNGEDTIGETRLGQEGDGRGGNWEKEEMSHSWLQLLGCKALLGLENSDGAEPAFIGSRADLETFAETWWIGRWAYIWRINCLVRPSQIVHRRHIVSSNIFLTLSNLYMVGPVDSGHWRKFRDSDIGLLSHGSVKVRMHVAC